MRWACILLPQLALDGVLRRCADPEAPRVLVGGSTQRRMLHAVSPAARALGLRRGMALTAAQALAHGFATAAYRPEDEARWHRFLAGWAYGYSSQVSLQFPHALLLEIQGSLGLFGPWPRFEARLREELTALGFRHRIVAAPNPVAARVLANGHDGLAIEGDAPLRRALGQLPIKRAGFTPEVATAFARMGLRTLRQVWALPRDGVARRFPAEVLRHLDALLDERDMALESYRPPDRCELRIELGHEVESSQALLFELARGRLEQVQLPAPVGAIALCADELPPFVPVHRELFDQRPQQAMPWEQLRERLRARLGEDAVHGVQARADHRPECASLSPPDVPVRHEASSPGTAPGVRPGWLLAKPVPLRGPMPRLVAGPERIESGWWDGDDVRRDYYLARLASGQDAWVFRPVGGGGFMLHGWFA